MLSMAPDFWLLFWAILAGGAAVTIVLSLVIATVPPRWTGWHHQPHGPAARRPATRAPVRAQGPPTGPRPASA